MLEVKFGKRLEERAHWEPGIGAGEKKILGYLVPWLSLFAQPRESRRSPLVRLFAWQGPKSRFGQGPNQRNTARKPALRREREREQLLYQGRVEKKETVFMYRTVRSRLEGFKRQQ